MQVVNAAQAIQQNPAAVFLDMFEEFATDSALETGGANVPYKDKGTVFKIARSSNTEYGEALQKAIDENRDALNVQTDEGREKAKALSKRLMLEVMADTILKGWENVVYKGQPLTYTRENAITLLGHDDFRQWVKVQSENREYFKARLIEEASKN